MPRTRRTPASDTPAQDAAAVETSPDTSDTSFTADTPAAETTQSPTDQSFTDQSAAANSEPAKAPRRRAPRLPKTEAPAADAAEVPPKAVPARRRGSRTASPEAVPAAPAADAPPPRRRVRRPIAPESEAPAALGEASAADFDVEAPVAETAVPETAVPVPARRRGRARQATAPEPATAAASPEPALEAATEMPAGDVPAEDVPYDDLPVEDLLVEAEDVPAEDKVPAPAEDKVPAPETASARRRRGRRRGALAPAAELPDVEAPVAETDAEEGAEDEAEPAEDAGTDAAKLSKRAKRGRRRRGGLEEVTTEMLEAAGATLLPEEVAEAQIAEEEDDDSLLVYPPPAPPIYAAPPLVARVLPPADNLAAPRVTATLAVQTRGLSKIRVNGADYAPYFFFVNTETARDGETVDAEIREAAANGIHLFSGIMYLPFRNAYGDRSFGPIDALVSQVLAADPDAFILPRLQFVPTNYWARTHPDQLAEYSNGFEGDVSLASAEFWADCVDALDALIAHFSDPATLGGDRVIGFHLDRGEWFYDATSGYDQSPLNQTAFQNWLHAKYQNLYALRAAWHDGEVMFEDAQIPAWPGVSAVLKKTDTPLYSTRREGRWPDYAQFSSDMVAEIISGLAEAVKTLSQNRLLVAASYGYTLEFAGRSDSGHLALGKLLQSPHLDIVAGPNSYAGRGVGSPSAFGAPLDSVTLRGKLWLVEDDTKTFLADAETDDTYNPKIASGADTQAIHQRHFGAALAHRAGVTWMDLWGQGWLNSPDIWRELGSLTRESSRWEQVAAPAAPDVAVFVDEASLAYLKTDSNGLGVNLVSRSRDLLLKAGASVGFYLQSDVTQPNVPDAKLYLFLNALRLTTEERAAVREKLQKPGKTLAWLYAPGIFDENGPSSEEAGEVVGMALRQQPWNSRGGSVVTDIKHPITDKIRGVKRLGTDEILNPLFAVSDPQATVIAEYAATDAASLAVREHKGGWKSVFFGDPQLTTELLRGLYAYANIPVYDAQDDAVYAGADGSLTIHGAFTGQRTISLPRKASVYDVFDGKIIATNARSFRAFVRARTTRLFLWGDGPVLSRATGLDLPASTAEVDPAPQTPPTVSAPPPLTPREPRPELSAALIPGLEPETILETVTALETLEVTITEVTSSITQVTADLGTDLDSGIDQDTDSDEAAADSEGTDPAGAPSRRSRWQRRRAATRARRDAERAAKLAEAPDGAAQLAPVDIATLMPGLPPRRTPPSASDPSPTPGRVADILAADIADDEAFGLSETSAFETTSTETTITETAALGFSDAALTDMSDDYGAAEEEAAEDE